MNGVNTQWHTLETADGPMRLYAAYPEQPATRAVVVLQEAFGVNEHIQDITLRFAEHGFLAVAPDLQTSRAGAEELRIGWLLSEDWLAERLSPRQNAAGPAT